jgi:hypothetical protein
MMGTAKTEVTASNNKTRLGEANFGKGVDITVSIAEGTNGVQQTGRNLQSAAENFPINPAAGSAALSGAILQVGGATLENAAPAGTIDGNMTVRITGNGNAQYVGGSVKDYPSYALYTYSVDANGQVQTTLHRKTDERNTEDLNKPMRPVP